MDFTDVYYKTDLLYIKIKINNIVLKNQHHKVNLWIHEANTLNKLLKEP